MTKPVVQYKGDATFFQVPLQDETYRKYADENDQLTMAHVFALNHPRLGIGMVRTSVVQKRYKNGNFETLNTKYKKVLDKQ
jgi:hypothetical protein